MEIDWKKKYEEALERARALREEAIEKEYVNDYVKDYEAIFPELAESEDEKIRKELIEFLREAYSRGNAPEKCAKWLVWLDWSKEQKPEYCHHEVDLSDCSEEYRKAYYDGWNNCNLQHAQLAEERKDSPKPEDTVIFQKGVEEGRRLEREDNKREWSEQDIQYYDAVMDMITNALYLPSRPRNEVIKWLKSLRPQPQQNMSIYFMMYLDEHRSDGKMCLSNAECNQIEVAFKNQDWDIILKYAEKYLPRWKPSEEQMRAFHELLGGKVPRAPELYELYNDLEKLM